MIRVSSPKEAVRLIEDGERVVLSVDGKDVALISADELKMIEEREDRLDNEAAERAMAEPGEDVPANVFWKELERRLVARRKRSRKRDKVAS